MKYQDASNPKVASYQNVRAKAESLIDLFAHAVDYAQTGISVTADPETTANLSEIVGIGAGLASACKVFRINPNRAASRRCCSGSVVSKLFATFGLR
jgi:hypothetical protein